MFNVALSLMTQTIYGTSTMNAKYLLHYIFCPRSVEMSPGSRFSYFADSFSIEKWQTIMLTMCMVLSKLVWHKQKVASSILHIT